MTGTAQQQAGAVPVFGLRPPTAAALNHLLKSASWARDRLRLFAGKVVCFELIPVTVAFSILESGEVANAPTGAPPDASFRLSPALALRVLSGDADAWHKVEVAGDTALAREILYIAQNLKWDVEQDLSRLFGDVIAHRMVTTAAELTRWQRDGARNFTESMAAYWTDERPLIATKYDVNRFVREVDMVRDDVARFEKRLEQWLKKDTSR